MANINNNQETGNFFNQSNVKNQNVLNTMSNQQSDNHNQDSLNICGKQHSYSSYQGKVYLAQNLKDKTTYSPISLGNQNSNFKSKRDSDFPKSIKNIEEAIFRNQYAVPQNQSQYNEIPGGENALNNKINNTDTSSNINNQYNNIINNSNSEIRINENNTYIVDRSSIYNNNNNIFYQKEYINKNINFSNDTLVNTNIKPKTNNNHLMNTQDMRDNNNNVPSLFNKLGKNEPNINQLNNQFTQMNINNYNNNYNNINSNNIGNNSGNPLIPTGSLNNNAQPLYNLNYNNANLKVNYNSNNHLNSTNNTSNIKNISNNSGPYHNYGNKALTNDLVNNYNQIYNNQPFEYKNILHNNHKMNTVCYTNNMSLQEISNRRQSISNSNNINIPQNIQFVNSTNPNEINNINLPQYSPLISANSSHNNLLTPNMQFHYNNFMGPHQLQQINTSNNNSNSNLYVYSNNNLSNMTSDNELINLIQFKNPQINSDSKVVPNNNRSSSFMPINIYDTNNIEWQKQMIEQSRTRSTGNVPLIPQINYQPNNYTKFIPDNQLLGVTNNNYALKNNNINNNDINNLNNYNIYSMNNVSNMNIGVNPDINNINTNYEYNLNQNSVNAVNNINNENNSNNLISQESSNYLNASNNVNLKREISQSLSGRLNNISNSNDTLNDNSNSHKDNYKNSSDIMVDYSTKNIYYIENNNNQDLESDNENQNSSRSNIGEYNRNFAHSSDKNKMSMKKPSHSNKNLKDDEIDYSKLSNEEVLSSAVQISQEQFGCRFLQKKILNEPEFANQILFKVIKPRLSIIIMNQFGNYLIQKLIDILTYKNLEYVIKNINKNILEYCKDTYGTRVVQKVMDYLVEESQIIEFVSYLTPHVKEFAKDSNANHVIIKSISSFSSELSHPIYSVLKKNLVEISKTKYGCCTIQKSIDCFSLPERKEKLVKKIVKHYYTLITDINGSYVIQFILNLKKDISCTNLLYAITKDSEVFLNLCQQKISCTLIEKCIENLEESNKSILIEAIITNQKLLDELASDSNGIYILKKCYDSCNMNQKNLLRNYLLSNLSNELNKNYHGRKLLNKISNMSQENTNNQMKKSKNNSSQNSKH